MIDCFYYSDSNMHVTRKQKQLRRNMKDTVQESHFHIPQSYEHLSETLEKPSVTHRSPALSLTGLKGSAANVLITFRRL